MKFSEVKDYLTSQWFKPRIDFHIHEDLEYGELYEADELGADISAQKEFVANFINGAHEWGNCELNIDGSGSFLIALLGYEGEDY